MKSWETFYTDGLGFRASAQRGLKRPQIFTPVIMHNLAAMAIEKFYMALLVFNQRMPDNHTLTDLINAVNPLYKIDDKLVENLLYMDSLQQICSMTEYKKVQMTDNDIPLFLDSMERVYEMVFPFFVDHFSEPLVNE